MYKKNRFHKVSYFLSVVKNNCSITKTATLLNKHKQDISEYILSFEKDLGFQLFDRNKNRLSLNANGLKYYNAISAINMKDVDKIFTKEYIDYVLKENNINVKKENSKMLIFNRYSSKKQFLLYCLFSLISILILAGLSTSFYLYRTNYFFDKELYQNSSSKLRTLIKDGHWNTSKHKPCSLDVMQINIDMYNLLDILTKKSEYKDLPVILFMLNEGPLISMRFSGDESKDYLLKEGALKCGVDKFYTDKSYSESKNLSIKTKELFARDKNFKIYNLYHGEDSFIGYEAFFNNLKKYQNNLFGIKIVKPATENYRGWMIKYRNYYYVLSVFGMSSDDKSNDQYVLFKKLTKKEFMNYSKGMYYDMVIKNNIII